jgi:hypothetical protein
MFTLSSAYSFLASIALTGYRQVPLPRIDLSTFRQLNTHVLAKNLLGKTLSLTSLRKTSR